MINFSAGPNKLVPEVERRLHDGCQTFPGSDIASWSISHREPRVHEAFDQCVTLVKDILDVPDNFEIIFTQGGATGMFKAWPMNICCEGEVVDVVLSGHWANAALQGLKEVQAGELIQIGKQFDGWHSVSYPSCDWGEYLYLVSNETVNGVQSPNWETIPNEEGLFVIDMSSDIMTRPIDFRKVGLAFASTQKNLGTTAGFCLCIVRQDLLECDPHSLLPAPLSFAEQLKHRGGLRNTVNPLGILSILFTLEWIKEQGGVPAMQRQAAARSEALYRAIDMSSGFFEGLAPKELRSRVNVTFRPQHEKLWQPFIDYCGEKGFIGLKGHAGLVKQAGLHARASMYVGATMEEVEALVSAMQEFASIN